jgi:hypothetical protein
MCVSLIAPNILEVECNELLRFGVVQKKGYFLACEDYQSMSLFYFILIL